MDIQALHERPQPNFVPSFIALRSPAVIYVAHRYTYINTYIVVFSLINTDNYRLV